MPVKPGDHVVFPASAGAWVEVDEERLLVCRVGELLGVLERGRGDGPDVIDGSPTGSGAGRAPPRVAPAHRVRRAGRLLPRPRGRPDGPDRPAARRRVDATSTRSIDGEVVVAITIPYHVRDAREPPSSAGAASSAATPTSRSACPTGTPFDGDAGPALAHRSRGTARRRPLELPGLRALAFGDRIVGVDGGLRYLDAATESPTSAARGSGATGAPAAGATCSRSTSTARSSPTASPVMKDARQAPSRTHWRPSPGITARHERSRLQVRRDHGLLARRHPAGDRQRAGQGRQRRCATSTGSRSRSIRGALAGERHATTRSRSRSASVWNSRDPHYCPVGD